MTAPALRDLHTLEEFRQVVELERTIWGYTDLHDVVTLPVFVITMKRGGILVGAFDAGDRLVGFVFSLAGLKAGRAMQWSHMLGVLPEHRRAGLGRRLKLAQRERALAAGLDLIEWTFDPLQTANAHLNFVRLGVVADEYARNVYGESTSALHRGTPTDRLIVQWNIREPHVERRLTRSSRLLLRTDAVVSAPVINETTTVGGLIAPAALDLAVDARRIWLDVPAGFTAIQEQAPDLALAWRLHTREAFEAYLSRGYRVVDFAGNAARGRYLMARPDEQSIADPVTGNRWIVVNPTIR